VAILVAFYSESVLVGLLGVAIMFASLVVFERNLRRMGKAGWHDLTRSLHDEQPSGAGGGIEHAVHGAREWFRSHLLRRDR
jgi:hypothetical protein